MWQNRNYHMHLAVTLNVTAILQNLEEPVNSHRVPLELALTLLILLLKPKLNNIFYSKLYAEVISVLLFMTAKKCRYSSKDESMNKMWYIRRM